MERRQVAYTYRTYRFFDAYFANIPYKKFTQKSFSPPSKVGINQSFSNMQLKLHYFTVAPETYTQFITIIYVQNKLQSLLLINHLIKKKKMELFAPTCRY